MAVSEPQKRRPGRPRLESPAPPDYYLKRRDEIVATAAEVFRVKGYAAGTLEDVAAALDVRRPTLYHYVRSKKQLLSLICEHVMSAILQAIEEVSRVEDPRERLAATVRVHITTIADHQDLFKVFFDERGSLPEQDQARMRELERRYVQAFAATAATAMDAGILPRTDPRQAALALIGLGTWIYKWFNPQRYDPATYAGTCLALLGIVPPQSCGPASLCRNHTNSSPREGTPR